MSGGLGRWTVSRGSFQVCVSDFIYVVALANDSVGNYVLLG
jgi:hypothetical protein